MPSTSPTSPVPTVSAEPVAAELRRPDAGPIELTADEIADVAGGFGPAGTWSATAVAQGPAGTW